MKGLKNPLFQWSLILGLVSVVLARTIIHSDSPLAEMSAGIQTLAAVFLSLIPATGIVLGVMSWKRRELSLGWIIFVLVFNAVQFLLVFLRLLIILPG